MRPPRRSTRPTVTGESGLVLCCRTATTLVVYRITGGRFTRDQEILLALGQLTPTLVAMTDAHMARDGWLTGGSLGPTEIQRLSYLMMMVKRIGNADLLDSIKQQLVPESGDKPVATTVRKYIARLEAE